MEILQKIFVTIPIQNSKPMAENPEKYTSWICRLDQYPQWYYTQNFKMFVSIALKQLISLPFIIIFCSFQRLFEELLSEL